MQLCQKISDNLFCLRIPYKDIFTTVYFIKTAEGVMLFDAASYDEDVDNYILPALDELMIPKENLKYVFISHPHRDHEGGLKRLLELLPHLAVISTAEKHLESCAGYNVILPSEEDLFLGALRVVLIPGHTVAAAGILDTRDLSLISGDSLQLYGIFGSGLWGSNIRFPKKHFEAVEKLRKMEINSIYAAHDYRPLGQFYVGRDKVTKALDCCVEPLIKVRSLIEESPELSDEAITSIYNDGTVPTLGAHVVAAIRQMLTE